MQENLDLENLRQEVLTQIKSQYQTDADFERAFELKPKTVSNWRRKRSSSFLKILPKITAVLKISDKGFIPQKASVENNDELQILLAYRKAEGLDRNKKDALKQRILDVIYKSIRGDYDT